MKSTQNLINSDVSTRSKRQMCVESAVFNDFRCFSYEKRRISLRAFRLLPSIGLSYERPNIVCTRLKVLANYFFVFQSVSEQHSVSANLAFSLK